jgi:putative phosphoribosyl transferase
MEPSTLFQNRSHAGRELAAALRVQNAPTDGLVLGLPRGGVVVASEVAKALNLELDVIVVRKLGLPGQEELAMGALATGGILLLNEEMISSSHLSQEQVRHVIEEERREVARRELLYRGQRPPLDVDNRSVIVVDDGLATGSTMAAAVTALRQKNPRQIVMAVPVAAADTCAEIKRLVDHTVCLVTSSVFYSVGSFYREFDQTSDEEVTTLLARAGTLA